MQRATDEPEYPEDGPGEGRWLSYDELSLLRGISRESAIRLARREKWRRTRGNDGTARIFCPPDWLRSPRKHPGDWSPGQSPEQPRQPSGDPGGFSKISKAFEAGLAAFSEQVEVERRRANWAELARDAARDELVVEREARAKAEGMAEAAVTRAERAEQEREELRADLARAEERLKQAEVERLVAAAAERSSLFRRLWRRR